MPCKKKKLMLITKAEKKFCISHRERYETQYPYFQVENNCEDDTGSLVYPHLLPYLQRFLI